MGALPAIRPAPRMLPRRPVPASGRRGRQP